MKEQGNPVREHWGGGLGFILAATGSAVGLGNVWKFPYLTGNNGGGAFVLAYLCCIALIGLPIIIAEITIGRHTQKDPISAFLKLSKSGTPGTFASASLFAMIASALFCFGKFGLGGIFLIAAALTVYYGWAIIGVMGVIAPFTIMAYYGAVGGWIIAYFVKGITQQLNFTTPEAAQEVFAQFITNGPATVFYQIVFMFLCGLVIWCGVKNGIELASKFLLPLLFLLVLVLMMRSLTLDGSEAGVSFLLSPDLSKITPDSILKALGQAFFSLSIGMGAMLTYGSYLESNKNIVTASLWIVFLDTLFALMTGLAIFPAVFAMGMTPEQGPSLIFQVMPMTFNAIGDHCGWIWTSIFFVLLFVAALTSAISIIEVCVAVFIDRFHFKRQTAVFWITLAITLVGILCTLSVSDWKNIPWLESIMKKLFGPSIPGSLFDALDQLSSNYLLPLGGLGIALFVGWKWGIYHALAEIRKGSENMMDVNFFTYLAGLKDDPTLRDRSHTLTLSVIWGIFVRFVSPVCIVLVFLYNIGWLKFH